MLPKIHTEPLFKALRKHIQSSLISFYKEKSFYEEGIQKVVPKWRSWDKS